MHKSTKAAIQNLVFLLPLATAGASDNARVLQSYGQLPLSFVANAGQADPSVRFFSRTPNYSVLLKNSGVAIKFAGKTGQVKAGTDTGLLEMRVRNARSSARIEAIEPQEGKANYLIGNDPKNWRVGLSTYGKVAYREILKGIDLVYHGNGERLEYDFEVSPHADPAKIALEMGGKGWAAHLDADGTLIGQSKDVSIRFDRPLAYQTGATGEREIVKSEYTLQGGNRVGFRLGSYDASRKLVIDPIAVMIYSTLLGGGGFDAGYAIAVDRFGYAYVTGFTNSVNFPLMNSYDAVCGKTGGCASTTDAFITKFNTTGTGIVYSTYLGGSANDSAYGIAVDRQGFAYITGMTQSTDFPVTKNAAQKACGPAFTIDPKTCALIPVSSCAAAYKPGRVSDVFVTKLTATGAGLVYSTYLGGSGLDSGTAITVDLNGEAYITGVTQSYPAVASCPLNGNPSVVGTPYPTSASAFLSGSSVSGGTGISHAFFTKLHADGSIVYSTALGSAATQGNAIAIDGANNAFIAGSTTDSSFPVTSGTAQTVCASCPASSDAFIAKFNPSASGVASLVWASYLGGPGADSATGVAIDATNHVYLTGNTASNPGFPTTSGVLQPASRKPAGSSLPSAFVSKLTPTASQLMFSTYMGGSDGSDFAFGLAVDHSNVEYVYGTSSSSDFPLVHPTFPEPAGQIAPYVARINPQGAAQLPAEFMNMPMNYAPVGGLALDDAGDAYIAGTVQIVTGSPFVTTTNAGGFVPSEGSYYQAANPAFENVASSQFAGSSGSGHVFVQKMGMTDVFLTPSVAGFTPSAPQPVGTPAAPITINLLNTGIDHLVFASISIVGPNAGDFSQTNTCLPFVVQSKTCTLTITFTPTAPGYRQAFLSLADSQPGPQFIQLTGFGQ